MKSVNQALKCLANKLLTDFLGSPPPSHPANISEISGILDLSFKAFIWFCISCKYKPSCVNILIL